MDTATTYWDNLEFIDSYYPERYDDEQVDLALRACRVLSGPAADQVDGSPEAVVRFLYDSCGIALEKNFASHPGWFPCTRDMAYDEYASRNRV